MTTTAATGTSVNEPAELKEYSLPYNKKINYSSNIKAQRTHQETQWER